MKLFSKFNQWAPFVPNAMKHLDIKQVSKEQCQKNSRRATPFDFEGQWQQEMDEEEEAVRMSLKKRFKWIRNNIQSISFTVLFSLLNLGLFLTRLYEYRNTNLFVMGARACGQCLNLDCAVLLALTLRRFITKLRNSPLGNILPCDRHIHLHKFVGWIVFLLSICHTIFHILNFALLSKQTGISLCSYLWDTSLGIGWLWGMANPTGVALLVILFIIVAFSHRCVRKSGKFEIFYFTHLLSFPFWILLIIHGPRVWKWLLIPGTAFLIEILIRVSQICSTRGRTTVALSQSFSSHVTKLVINRPKDFEFRAGEYVYLNIPSVTKYEWHAFTISSAPEEEDIFTVHIRAIGGWTEKVYELFKERNGIGDETSSNLEFPQREQKISLTNILESVSMHEDDKMKHHHQQHDIWARGNKYNENLKEFNRKISVPCRTSSKQEDHRSKYKSFDRRKSSSFGSLSEFNDKAHLIPPDSGRSSLTASMSSLHDSANWPSFGYPFYNGMSDHISVSPVDKETSPCSGVKIWIETIPEVEDRREDNDRSTFPDAIPLEVYVNGPYGSPSSNIFNVNHAVLIGAGIGVTPFASILQSVMFRYHEAKIPCPHCKISSCLSLPSTLRKLRKVDFIWVNRDLRHFEWFLELLAGLEEEQSVVGAAMEKFLNLHLYKTGSEHFKFPIPLASAIHHGRPDWDQILSSIRERKQGKVCVYYCGPPALSTLLREKCLKHQLGFRREMF